MKLFTVWDRTSTGIGEKCFLKDNGDYIGKDTGKLYTKKEGYYHSKQHIGIIKNVDENNQTGMYHLSEEAEFDYKTHKMKMYIGCYVTLESAHSCGDVKVYRCLELKEYVTSNEVEILTELQVRQWKIEEVLSDKN